MAKSDETGIIIEIFLRLMTLIFVVHSYLKLIKHIE